MVRKPDIQYIDKFYVQGSEARVLERNPQKRKAKTVLPRFAPQKETVIRIDALSLCAIAVAVTMIVLMVVGCFQLKASYEHYEAMNDYVLSLQNENVKLTKQYRAGFDPVDIQWKAHSLGLVPMDEVKIVSMPVTIPEAETAPSLWENVVWFLEGLLA